MLLADSGAEFVRTSITWARVEHSPGERDFAPFDAIAEQLEADGLRPFWVVTGAPCWAAAQACTEEQPHRAPAPAHDDDFARFAVEVAKRYPDAVGLEIWNEPNIPNFWEPEPDAGRYRELLATTAEAVHASGSEVPVVMAGPSPTTDAIAADDPRKIPFADFIEEVMNGPDAPDVDAIGVHPYSLLQVGPDPADETLRLYEQARAAAERAAPGVPIWITEVGPDHRRSPSGLARRAGRGTAPDHRGRGGRRGAGDHDPSFPRPERSGLRVRRRLRRRRRRSHPEAGLLRGPGGGRDRLRGVSATIVPPLTT